MGFGNVSMRIEMYLGRDLRRRLFTHLQELSFSFYNVTPVGYLISRVMNDTNKIAGMLAWNLADMLWALSYLIFVLAAMLALNLEAGAGGDPGRAGGAADGLFPEPDPALEPQGPEAELADNGGLQRGDNRGQDLKTLVIEEANDRSSRR